MLEISNNRIFKKIEVTDSDYQSMIHEKAMLEKQIEKLQNHLEKINFEIDSFASIKDQVKKPETKEKKLYDNTKAIDNFEQGRVFVNVAKWEATIHTEYIEGMEYDPKRWDKFFDTMEEAQDYTKVLSSE